MSFSLTIMMLSLPTLYTRLLVESALTKKTGAVCPSITPIGFLCSCMHAVLLCVLQVGITHVAMKGFHALMSLSTLPVTITLCLVQ